jgi:hypothetical protein
MVHHQSGRPQHYHRPHARHVSDLGNAAGSYRLSQLGRERDGLRDRRNEDLYQLVPANAGRRSTFAGVFLLANYSLRYTSSSLYSSAAACIASWVSSQL